MLRKIAKQGLKPRLFVKDTALNIAAGINRVFPEAEQRDDVFHTLYENEQGPGSVRAAGRRVAPVFGAWVGVGAVNVRQPETDRDYLFFQSAFLAGVHRKGGTCRRPQFARCRSLRPQRLKLEELKRIAKRARPRGSYRQHDAPCVGCPAFEACLSELRVDSRPDHSSIEVHDL